MERYSWHYILGLASTQVKRAIQDRVGRDQPAQGNSPMPGCIGEWQMVCR
jgi:hypothetical protein